MGAGGEAWYCIHVHVHAGRLSRNGNKAERQEDAGSNAGYYWRTITACDIGPCIF